MSTLFPHPFTRPHLHTLLWVILAGAVLLLTGCRHETNTAQTVPGVFDLRGRLSASDATVPLDGPWEFYWDQLLTPDDFRPENIVSKQIRVPKQTGYFRLPGSWMGFKSGDRRLPGTGQATFRLRLVPDREAGQIVLRLFDIHDAYRLWANGSLIAQSGIPGVSVSEEKPVRSLVLAEVDHAGEPIELVLQVSNHHFRTGGVSESIVAANPGTLEEARIQARGTALFFAGSMVIMGLYHLVLFFLQKRNPAPLYFALYCFLVVGYCLTSNTSLWVASVIFPGWNPTSMEVFSLTCFVVWASLIFRFLRTLYPDEFHPVMQHLLDARIVIYFVLLLFAPRTWIYWFMAVCLLQTFIYSVYYLQRLALCVRRGKSGAQFLLAGFAVQFVAGVNDPLAHMGLIDSVYITLPAVFFLVLTQSLALAQRFSAAFDSVELLSTELEHKNVSLQTEMDERNRLEQEVVNISENERRRISHELHDSLCQKLTGARLRASALAHKQKGKADAQELKELAGLLKESTDDAYKTTRGLWPVEHDTSLPGPSLEGLARDIAEAEGIDVVFQKQCACEKCTNPNMTPLYRIAQEALTNAAKHSQAKNIQVHLLCSGDGKVELSVRDDGIGRTAANTRDGGMGMGIMAHRAKLINAELQINDAPQGGTQVVCSAPCDLLGTSSNHDDDGQHIAEHLS